MESKYVRTKKIDVTTPKQPKFQIEFEDYSNKDTQKVVEFLCHFSFRDAVCTLTVRTYDTSLTTYSRSSYTVVFQAKMNVTKLPFYTEVSELPKERKEDLELAVLDVLNYPDKVKVTNRVTGEVTHNCEFRPACFGVLGTLNETIKDFINAESK